MVRADAPDKPSSEAGGIEKERAFTDAEIGRLRAGPPSCDLANFMRVGALTGMRQGKFGC
jgi:hypothetical protein